MDCPKCKMPTLCVTYGSSDGAHHWYCPRCERSLEVEISTLKSEVDKLRIAEGLALKDRDINWDNLQTALRERDLARKELQEAREAVKMACEETGDCHEGTLEMVIPFWRQNVCPHCSLFKPTPSPAGDKFAVEKGEG